MISKSKGEYVTVVGSKTTQSHHVTYSTSTGPAEKIHVERIPSPWKDISDHAAREAVYNHLRLLRSQGRTTVSTDEVAKGLSLPLSQVERIIDQLRPRGVKVER